MKTLTAVFASLFLTACVVESDPSQSKKYDSSSSYEDINRSDGKGLSNLGCDQVSYVFIVVENKSFWVKVPSLCDPNEEIYRGDPGPDMGSKFDSKSNPETTQLILENLYARLANSGFYHQSADD